MKTKAEIRETIEQTRAHVRHLRELKWSQDYGFHNPPGLEEGEGWINALEWVLEGESFSEEEKDPIEEEFPHLTRKVLEDEPKSNQV